MRKICLDLSNCLGLGDTISATPAIRKLYDAYESKISVITKHNRIFEGNPYVDNIWNNDIDDVDTLTKDYERLHSFLPNLENIHGMPLKHNCFDIRQFHAAGLGFTLLPSEMHVEFTPNDFEEIPNLPEKYILLHPVQTWNSRTWSRENWEILTTLLNKNNIPVVVVGKDSSEIGFSMVDKPVFKFNIERGLNLLNKTSLSQTWWLIQKSMCFITMDSGLLHLAGTTDANILQLGSSIDYRLRAPYRNGSQDYKYHYVGGSCNIACASNMKYSVTNWNSIRGIPSLVNCLENKKTFECHPTVVSVFNKLIQTKII